MNLTATYDAVAVPVFTSARMNAFANIAVCLTIAYGMTRFALRLFRPIITKLSSYYAKSVHSRLIRELLRGKRTAGSSRQLALEVRRSLIMLSVSAMMFFATANIIVQSIVSRDISANPDWLNAMMFFSVASSGFAAIHFFWTAMGSVLIALTWYGDPESARKALLSRYLKLRIDR